MRAKAFVLISIGVGAARDVYTRIAALEFVQQVHVVTGPYDMIAVVDGPTFNDIGRLVIEKIQAIPGITSTITCNVIFLEN